MKTSRQPLYRLRPATARCCIASAPPPRLLPGPRSREECPAARVWECVPGGRAGGGTCGNHALISSPTAPPLEERSHSVHPRGARSAAQDVLVQQQLSTHSAAAVEVDG
ncbi:hypothetical protein E2C01_002211 [Portunus trituberculatus]|uniref:Uncharacterized protein n=1 Tax=Portunus trituberculatus TaxID=210409 RepID=A0A5B7CMN2_PORTR|nr:hypothetical protein [Portunus trituberculatus]